MTVCNRTTALPVLPAIPILLVLLLAVDLFPAGGGEAAAGLFRDLGGAARTAGHDASRFVTSPLRIDRRGLALLGGIAAAGGLVYAYDEEVLELFERNRGESYYDFFIDTGESVEAAGHSGRTFPFYMGGLAAGYATGCEPLTVISAELLEYQLIPGMLRNLAKGMIGRPRPEEKRDPRYFKFGGGQSNPSGHAANIFAVAAVLSHRIGYMPVSVAGYFLATCVSLQRVDAEAHWPSDVFFGAVYGTASMRLLMKLHDESGCRVEPVVYPESGLVGARVRIGF